MNRKADVLSEPIHAAALRAACIKPLVELGVAINRHGANRPGIDHVIEDEHRFISKPLYEAETVTLLLPEVDLTLYFATRQDLSDLLVALASFQRDDEWISDKMQRNAKNAFLYLLQTHEPTGLLRGYAAAL